MDIQWPRSFADFVRSHRLHRGMTQQNPSEQTSMNRRWVQELESGNLVPSLEAALNVATVLGYELHLDPMPSSSRLDAHRRDVRSGVVALRDTRILIGEDEALFAEALRRGMNF